MIKTNNSNDGQNKKFASDIFNTKVPSLQTLLRFASIIFISHPGVCMLSPIDTS